MPLAAETLPDQIKAARHNTTAVDACNAILAGAFTNIQPDRLAVFLVPYTREIAPCTKTNLIFESADPGEITKALKILGAQEISDAKLSARSDGSQKTVLAFFSKGEPVAWFVVVRSYKAVLVIVEHQFRDGKWIATGGKVVNDLENWMRQRSIGFEAGGRASPPDKPKP